MKTIITNIILSLALASTASAGATNYLAELRNLEKQGKNTLALGLAIEAFYSLYYQLGVEQVALSTSTKLQTIQKEVVTKRHNAGFSFSLLMGLISGKARASWDVTKIITLNPEETELFPAKAAADFRSLQKGLEKYILKNISSLILLKAYAAKALQLGLQLSPTERERFLKSLDRVQQLSQKLTFYGTQSIVICNEIRYANRLKKESAELSSFILSFGFQHKERQFAHSEISCNSSVFQTSVNEAVVHSYKLYYLDEVIRDYGQALGRLQVIEGSVPTYPTWGSPYY